ncbi:MAG TPA: hypothetical protein VIE91_10475 [Methylophilaceae bacterium]|jgi:hypothetical protein
MKLTTQEWRKLRYPLIALGIAVILVTLLVSYVQNRKAAAIQALITQQGQLNQARQKYQASGAEKETIVKYLPIYQKLISDGFIGEERRIEWVDGLRSIHRQNKLFGIKYNIGAQEDYKPSFTLNVGTFTLHRSVMKLELSMLHEGDLLTMLEALDTQETTPFIVRECEISRLSVTNTAVLAPSLLANCDLDWLTIREPQAVEGK